MGKVWSSSRLSVPENYVLEDLFITHVPLTGSDIAYLCGRTGTVSVAKTMGNSFFMDTEAEEVVIFTEDEDLIVASSFGTGEKVERGLRCTIYQIRELASPLIVLPKGHPASPRLKVVVSIGGRTRLSCRIQPGTHPEQDVLCGTDEFDGLEILASPGGFDFQGFSGEVRLGKI